MMMTEHIIPSWALASPISLRGLFIAIPLALFAILIAYVVAKQGKTKKQKPGQYLAYTVPGQTVAACRGLLNTPAEADLFAYTLETAQNGSTYIHFTLHRPTQQPLDTLFLLQFDGDDPANFSLSFVREAFGMREPVIGEELLDAFFANKLNAQRQHALPE